MVVAVAAAAVVVAAMALMAAVEMARRISLEAVDRKSSWLGAASICPSSSCLPTRSWSTGRACYGILHPSPSSTPARVTWSQWRKILCILSCASCCQGQTR